MAFQNVISSGKSRWRGFLCDCKSGWLAGTVVGTGRSSGDQISWVGAEFPWGAQLQAPRDVFKGTDCSYASNWDLCLWKCPS